ncbi:monocarboxylate transporter 12-like [Glandiceps talaboti]
MVGGVLSFVSFLVSSFATSVVYLYASLGFFAGISLGLTVIPTGACLGRYFRRRYALANSIAVIGSGVSSFTMPLLCRLLIDSYGWRGTMIVLAAVSANFCVAATLLRPIHLKSDFDVEEKKPEISPTISDIDSDSSMDDELQHEPSITEDKNEKHHRENVSDHKLNLKRRIIGAMYFFISMFKEKPLSIILMIYWFIYGFGLGISRNHFVDNAIKIGVDDGHAALMISITGIINCASCLAAGIVLSCANAKDGITNTHCFAVTTYGTAVVLVPLANSFESLVGISVVMGTARGVFSALDEVIIKQVVGEKRLIEGMGISWLFIGIGFLLGPPFSGYLFDYSKSYSLSFYCAGLIMVVGSTFLPLAWLLKKIKKRSTATSDAP